MDCDLPRFIPQGVAAEPHMRNNRLGRNQKRTTKPQAAAFRGLAIRYGDGALEMKITR